MKKILFVIAFLAAFLATNAQVYPPKNNGWGAISNRASFDSVLFFPTGCGVPTDSTGLFSQGFADAGQKLLKWALYGDSCGGMAYLWNPKLQTWSSIGANSGGSSIDSLYSRGDSIFYQKNGTEYFAFILSGGSGTVDTVSNVGYMTRNKSYTALDSAMALVTPWLVQADYAEADNTKQDYIKNKPVFGTAAFVNVPSSGNATSSQAVLGSDTRLGGSGVDSSKIFSFGWFNPEFFGCKGDGIVLNDGAATASSTTFTSATANFTSADVGKSIRIQGAGTSNVDFYTTIASVTNSTTVVLTDAAVSTKTATTFDYGTDNTTPIQLLLNYTAAEGGGRDQFKRGLYLLFGPLQTSVNGVNPNSQLYLPLTEIEDSAMRLIQIVGEYTPYLLSPLSTGNDVNIPQNCTVFKSEIDGTGTNPSIIGSPYYTPAFVGGATYNFTSCNLDNIVFQTKSSVNNTAVAGTMSCVNFYDLSQARISSCGAFTESPLYGGATAVNKTFGFIMPKYLNNAVAELNFVFAFNYNTGYMITEHNLGSQVTAVCDSIGLDFHNYYPGGSAPPSYTHSSNIVHLQIEDCVTPIVASGGGTLHITSFGGERQPSGSWFSAGPYDVNFTSDSAAVFIEQLDMALSGTSTVLSDIKTNSPSQLKIKYNFRTDVDNTQVTLPYASSITANVYEGKKMYLGLSGNTALTFTNLAPGDKIQLELIQDVVGGRTVTFPPNSVFKPGQVISTAPNLTDLCTGYYDGTAIFWNIDGGYLNTNSGGVVGTYVSFLVANSYTPGSPEIAGYTAFYNSLVSQGLLAHMKAIYLFSGSTAETHALNFLDPENTDAADRITWHGTVTHTYGTVTGDGSTGYGDTHVNPSTDLTFPTGGITAWSTSTTLLWAAGSYEGTGSPGDPGLQSIGNFDGSNSYYIGGDNSGNFITVGYPGTDIDGPITNTRTSTSLMTAYRYGTSIGTSSGTISSTAYPNENMYVLARNADGSVGNPSSNPLIFFIVHNGSGLTDTQVSNLSDDLVALKTAMSK